MGYKDDSYLNAKTGSFLTCHITRYFIVKRKR